MNNITSIGDEEFTPFLHSLGVETYNKSFEWMLSDPEFGEVLRWIYKNIDHNNALSIREECRYTEIEKKGNLLSNEELEATLLSIQQEYTNISLPGDPEEIEDVKLDNMMQKEKLTVLERHDVVYKDLIRQNELIKQELDMQLIKLNAAQRQCEEDEATAAEDCLQLAEEVDSITNSVVDVITNTLNVYSSCHNDKVFLQVEELKPYIFHHIVQVCKGLLTNGILLDETAKRFLTFGSFDTYRQLQGLFRSHFDLYTTKKFDKRNDDVTEDDLRAALVEARNMEKRLSDALTEYIESKAELSGEQAKLLLVSNYTNVHPSQITSCMMEAQSSLELLEQEESILEQQLGSAARELVASRTSLAVDTATNSALLVREQVSKELSFLVEVTQHALAVDRLLYGCLRCELRALEEVLHFAAHLRLYITEERDAVSGRLQSMKEISLEHESTERSLESGDVLLNTLCSALNVDAKDPVLLVQRYSDLLNSVQELRETVGEGFADKERLLEEFKVTIKPLMDYVFDGCTMQPNCHDRGLSALAHTLRAQMDRVDGVVLQASGMFQTVKNGDKRNLRKLWQWFLTEPGRLLAAVRGAQRQGCT